MARKIHCLFLNRDAEGLDYVPYPGELGKRIYESISKEAWAQWVSHQTMLINENRLTPIEPKARAFLVAEIQGWQANLKNPVLGATLAAKKYGKDQKLTVKEQTLESKSENTVILTQDTATNGLFTIGDELLKENIDTLALAGIDISQDKLFDMSVITEVYDENPDLKTSPVNPTTPS